MFFSHSAAVTISLGSHLRPNNWETQVSVYIFLVETNISIYY